MLGCPVELVANLESYISTINTKSQNLGAHTLKKIHQKRNTRDKAKFKRHAHTSNLMSPVVKKTTVLITMMTMIIWIVILLIRIMTAKKRNSNNGSSNNKNKSDDGHNKQMISSSPT